MEATPIQYFSLEEGVLELHEDKIVIIDKAKRNLLFERFCAICWTTYAAAGILIGSDKGWLCFHLFIFFAFLAILATRLIDGEITDNQIYTNNITSISLRHSSHKKAIVGKIKTKQNRLRQILISKVNLQDIKLQNELRKMNILTIEK